MIYLWKGTDNASLSQTLVLRFLPYSTLTCSVSSIKQTYLQICVYYLLPSLSFQSVTYMGALELQNYILDQSSRQTAPSDVYGTPVWAFSNTTKLESVQHKFLTRALGIPISTSMAKFHSETLCYSIGYLAKKAPVLFWLKLVYHIDTQLFSFAYGKGHLGS